MKKFITTQQITDIVEAIKSRRIIEVNYMTSNVKTNFYREIHPKGLVLNPAQPYVIALCTQEMRDKRFYINRILDVKTTPSNYLS